MHYAAQPQPTLPLTFLTGPPVTHALVNFRTNSGFLRVLFFWSPYGKTDRQTDRRTGKTRVSIAAYEDGRTMIAKRLSAR